MFAIGLVLAVIGFLGAKMTDNRTLPCEDVPNLTALFLTVTAIGGTLILISLTILAWRFLP